MKYGRVETTDQQAFELCDDFSAEAKRRFPFSARNGLVFGSGKFPLSLRCRTPWIVQLWTTTEARHEAMNKMCGARCTFNHRLEETL